MSTSVLEALPGKLDIKRHSPSILYVLLPYCVIYLEIHLLTRILTAQFPRGITCDQKVNRCANTQRQCFGNVILQNHITVLTYKLYVLNKNIEDLT